MLPSLLEIVFLIGYSFSLLAKKPYIADFEFWLRIDGACFYIFLVTSSVDYAILGLGWVRVLSASKCSRLGRLLLVGRFLGDFVIAAFAICAIWIEPTSQEQQTLLLGVVRPTTRIGHVWLNRCRLSYY